MQRLIPAIAGLLLIALTSAAQDRFARVTIVPGANAGEVERRFTDLLADRLRETSSAHITIGNSTPDFLGLTIYLGTETSHAELAARANQLAIPLPKHLDPGQEGFVLASKSVQRAQFVLAIGADPRGVLYAVGEILRQAEGDGPFITFPTDLHLRRAPRWPVRGLLVFQGHTMRELTGARAWTTEEWQRAHIDYALAGANTFELGESADESRAMFDFLKSYGLDALTVINGNSGSGPPEWQAKEAIGRTGYLSPVIPEARAWLLENREEIFKAMPAFDYVHIKSGDGGGDESEAAAPYGKALVELAEEYTRILHQYHPNTRVFVGNQKLDNAGDAAIFEYFQTHPETKIQGIVYGPGSNAMGWTPGRRQDHRMDLFEYARRGAVGGYLREMLHQLPPQQSILLFTDLTHWVYSQYGLMDHEIIADRNYQTPPQWDYWMYERRPSEQMAMVYDRRTFHARPRNYYRVFQETTEFTIGDVAYSEGHHDHANQWIYQRLFWEPHQSVEDTVLEYARAHFGNAAAPLMAEAMFTLEENIQTDVIGNDGIDRLIDLVEQAGGVMPTALRDRSHLWREYLQKAYLDKYIQLDATAQMKLNESVITELKSALGKRKLTKVAAELADATLPEPSNEMIRLRNEAERLGKESDALYGVRSEGLFNLEQDYYGFGWTLSEIKRAAAAQADEEREAIIHRVVHYEDPGEGGFYDNAGVPGEAPRLVYGWPFGDGGFSSANRHSQRTMAFTTDEERGVTFRYTNLDPNAQYRVRLTLVRPRYLPRFAINQHQTSQSIYGDDQPLAENLELPEYEAGFFEYEIPKSTTADGELMLWMKKAPGIGEGLASDIAIWRNTGGWGTLVSEVWLTKSN